MLSRSNKLRVMRHRSEYLLFLLFRLLVLVLPLKSARRLGAAAGDLAYRFLASRRTVAAANLSHAFPAMKEQERDAIARAAFRNFGIAIAEFLWFPNLSDAELRRMIRIRNPELLLDACRRGKGMVILSGHYGNWELIAFGVAYLCAIPFTIIVQTQSNRYIDAVINRNRCLRGNRVVPKDKSVREILKTLQGGGIVAIAPDQSASKESIHVDFFGRQVATHQGPAVFALRSGAPMQMGFLTRSSDGSYDVIIEEVPFSDLSGFTEANVIELTQRHTALLEKYIRMHPDHWLWMHRRWKHTTETVRGERPDSPPARA